MGTDELFCGYCKKPFDRDKWIADETCIHCGKFLDNPPRVFQKGNFRRLIRNLRKIKEGTSNLHPKIQEQIKKKIGGV